MGEVVERRIVVNAQFAVIALITMDTARVDGLSLPPVVDDLRHGGGYTAGKTMTVRAFFVHRAHGVIVLPLIPRGGQ